MKVGKFLDMANGSPDVVIIGNYVNCGQSLSKDLITVFVTPQLLDAAIVRVNKLLDEDCQEDEEEISDERMDNLCDVVESCLIAVQYWIKEPDHIHTTQTDFPSYQFVGTCLNSYRVWLSQFL